MSDAGGLVIDSLEALRAACVPRDRVFCNLDCNAALWLGVRAGLDARAASLALPGDTRIDVDRLMQVPYLASIGFAHAVGLTCGDADALRDALSRILERAPHTKELGGYADKPWPLIGLTLLAKGLNDHRSHELLISHVLETMRPRNISASVTLASIHALGLNRLSKAPMFEIADARVEAVLAAHAEGGVFEKLFPGQTREQADGALFSHARLGKFEPSARFSSLLALTALEVVLFADKPDRVSALETKKSGSPKPQAGGIESYPLEKQMWYGPLLDPGNAGERKMHSKIRILFLGANPSDTTRLALGREVREITRRLRSSGQAERFEFVQEWAVRVSDLHEALLRHRPQIVHFSGHGQGARSRGISNPIGTREMLPADELDELSMAGGILLEDDAGRAVPIPIPAFANLFGIVGCVRCVVLNACHSAAQAEAIHQHVDAVVGMSRAIQDTAAVNFAWAFYQGLAFGESLRKAFELGRNQIDLAGLADGKVPTLLIRQTVTDARVFVADSMRPHDKGLSLPTNHTALRIPIDERVLALLDLAKREMARQNLRFLTPSLLLVLLGLNRPVSCFERVRPGLSSILRKRLLHYVSEKLPCEGLSFVPFEWGDLDQVKKAEEFALLDQSPVITDKHLLLGVIESGGSTIRSLQSVLKEDFSKLVEVISELPAFADGPLLHTPGIDLE